jgi:hypothetical protein
MAKYSSSGSQTLTSSIVTALAIGSNASTVQRNWVYEFVIANVGTPADLVTLHTIQRTTAIGTQTAVTPTVLDFADRAAQADVGENHTGEPTYTSNEEVFEIPLNNRGTYKWQAAPGSEIVCPATAGDGIGFGATHASATTDWRAGILHYE